MKVSSNWDDSIPFEARTYEDQPYSQRVQHGLAVDRQRNHFTAYMFKDMVENTKCAEEGRSGPLIKPDMMYGYYHSFWNTKRTVNAKIADLVNIHKQMIELFKPILLDLLVDRQPTAKDWKRLSDKNEKQVRRTEEDYPHIVGQLKGGVELRLRNKDGTVSVYPRRIVRKGNGDDRTKEITTAYSSPPLYATSFDQRVFADDAYARRQRKFWQDGIRVLSKLLEEGYRVRKGQDWILYHIVNNDIALHVIFGNLSFVCESRWFGNLSENAQREICLAHANVYDEDAFRELGLPIPYAFSLDHAKKAVIEHESFVADFRKEMPDNLQRFMISQPKMKNRVHDMIIEAAAALKPYTDEPAWAANARRLCPQTWLLHFADDWELVCAALASSSLSSSDPGLSAK